MSKSKFTVTDLFGNKTKYISYKLNGETVTRRSSAPTKERINNDPAFTEVKKNTLEFAGATVLSKAIRNQHIEPVYSAFKDSYMAGRLTGVCRKIIQQGAGDLGQREACIAKHGSALIHFPFNKQKPLNYVFNGPIQVQTTPARTSLTIETQIAKLLMSGQPKQATHVQLTAACITVAKHTFNNKTKSYTPKHPKQNALGQYAVSVPIPISTTVTDLQMQLELPITEPLANTTAVIVALGITFGTLENKQFIDVLTGKAMNIIEIV